MSADRFRLRQPPCLVPRQLFAALILTAVVVVAGVL
jgi:hypothetical protein